MTIEFAIGLAVVAFIVLCVMAGIILRSIKSIHELMLSVLEKMSMNENRCKKIEAAADWWVHHNDCMYDYSSYSLAVMPIKKDKSESLSSVWAKIQANRETIVYHLYQAHLRALQDFDQQKQEQTKNNRKKK